MRFVIYFLATVLSPELQTIPMYLIGLFFLAWDIHDAIQPRPAIIVQGKAPEAPPMSATAVKMVELLESRQKCGCPNCKQWLSFFAGEVENPTPHKAEGAVETPGGSVGHYL